jgi:hypothetical protein
LRKRAARSVHADPAVALASDRLQTPTGEDDGDFKPGTESDEDPDEVEGEFTANIDAESSTVNDAGAITLVKPVFDPETGFYRVSKQAPQAQQPVRTAPKHFVWLRLGNRATSSGAMPVDRRLEGNEASSAEFEHVMQFFFDCHEEQHTGWLKAPMDAYLGLEMFQSTGPQNRTYEAVYPFTVAGQRLAYHANPNVHPVSFALNHGRGRSGPLGLVVTAEWMRTRFVDGGLGITAQKARWRWCYNAMTNIRIMDIATGYHVDKKVRQSQWSKWSTEFMRAILESLRTGILSPEMREVIEAEKRSRYFKTWSRT